jgi:pilus assembly protein FimV
MERLLELKSDPLASLQNNAGNMDVEPVPGDEAGEEAVLEGEVEVPAAETEEEVPADSDGEIAAMETADTAEAEDATEAEDAAPEDVTADDTEVPVSETRGIVNRLMDNPVLAGLGVLVAMLLGGFLWGSMRRQGNKGMFDDEPTLDKQVAAGSDEASKPAEPAITVSDPGTFDVDTPDHLEGYPEEGANDPVTEADVYLAYGRVHQAEDVLQAALKEDPDNLAIRAKLLEVFHAAGNVAAFNIAASEYRELAPEDDAQWSGIAAFGYELSPGNELYSAAKQISGDTSHSADFDMDLSGLNDVSDRSEATADTDDLAFTIDADAETGEADERPGSIEFSLDETGEDEAQGEGLLASTDEVATKLDLARAYLDMEDPEGARSILKEVMEEGNAEQRSEAESLISNIV